MKRRRRLRLHRHDLGAAAIPGGDAANEPAAAHRHQNRIERRRLALELECCRPLADQRQRLVVGVDLECPGFFGPSLAGE